jgi:DNA-binding transcriptional LysR family regulator
VAWALAATRSLLVASTDYLAAHGSPATRQDLAAHRCVHYPRTQGAMAWSFVPADTVTEAVRTVVPVAGGFAANNSEMLRDAAMAGLGIALVPDFSAQSGLASGHLREVLPGWRPVDAFGEHLFAIRPYASHVPRAVAVFVEFLRASFAVGFIR